MKPRRVSVRLDDGEIRPRIGSHDFGAGLGSVFELHSNGVGAFDNVMICQDIARSVDDDAAAGAAHLRIARLHRDATQQKRKRRTVDRRIESATWCDTAGTDRDHGGANQLRSLHELLFEIRRGRRADRRRRGLGRGRAARGGIAHQWLRGWARARSRHSKGSDQAVEFHGFLRERTA
jgi:hypothetical protein